MPTLTLAGLTAPQKRAYVLADNRLAEKAGWNSQILDEELKFLFEIEIDFDISITGFDTVEIDRLVDGLQGTADSRADEVPTLPPDQPVASRLGDVWLLGRHHLLCGDALGLVSYERLLVRA